MNSKISTLFEYIKQLCESDLDRIISFVLSIICVNQQSEETQLPLLQQNACHKVWAQKR